MDLIKSKMAELPKDEPLISSAFLFPGYSQEEVMSYQKVPKRNLLGIAVWELLRNRPFPSAQKEVMSYGRIESGRRRIIIQKGGTTRIEVASISS